MKNKALLCGIILIGLMGIPAVSNAQAARVAKEVVKGVGKAASNNKKGISNAAKKTTSKTTNSSSRSEKTTRPVMVSCSSCSGNGYTTTWNSHSRSYVRTKCSKCNGTGKIRRIIRY